MDVRDHQIAERGVDRAMAGQWRHPGKASADHVHEEVPAAVARAGMAGVQMAFIHYFEEFGVEGGLDRRTYRRSTLFAWQSTRSRRHGSTRRNGRTSTRS